MREIIRHMCLSSKHAIEKNGRKDVQEEIIFRLLFLVSFSRKGAIRFIYVHTFRSEWQQRENASFQNTSNRSCGRGDQPAIQQREGETSIGLGSILTKSKAKIQQTF